MNTNSLLFFQPDECNNFSGAPFAATVNRSLGTMYCCTCDRPALIMRLSNGEEVL